MTDFELTMPKEVVDPVETDALKGEDAKTEQVEVNLEEEIEIDQCCFGIGKLKRPTKGCCGFELEARPDFR